MPRVGRGFEWKVYLGFLSRRRDSNPRKQACALHPFSLLTQTSGYAACRSRFRVESVFGIFEPKAGLEPATYALRMRCSTN